MNKFGRKDAVSKTDDTTPMQNYILSENEESVEEKNTENNSKITKIDKNPSDLSAKMNKKQIEKTKKAKAKKPTDKKAKTKKAKIEAEAEQIRETADSKSLNNNIITNRLALVKQDWNILRAVDIYVLYLFFTFLGKTN